MKKKPKDIKNIIKTVIYALLAAGCVVLFAIFGRKQPKPAYRPNESSRGKQDEEIPSPPFCNYLISILKEGGMPCGFSEPAAHPDGTISYRLVFEDKNDEGCIIIKPDKDFYAVRCELRLSYLYTGIPPEGEINKTLIREYERRETLHKELITKYLSAAAAALDYTDSVNNADILTVTDAVIKSYSEMKAYNKTFGELRFNT